MKLHYSVSDVTISLDMIGCSNERRETHGYSR